MSPILSANTPASDIVEVSNFEVIGVLDDVLSPEEDAQISASLAFYRWWDARPYVMRCEILTGHARECFTAGFLSAPSEHVVDASARTAVEGECVARDVAVEAALSTVAGEWFGIWYDNAPYANPGDDRYLRVALLRAYTAGYLAMAHSRGRAPDDLVPA